MRNENIKISPHIYFLIAKEILEQLEGFKTTDGQTGVIIENSCNLLHAYTITV
jgi:hypothetical protein